MTKTYQLIPMGSASRMTQSHGVLYPEDIAPNLRFNL
jgi:hypothetical protein